MTSDLIQKWSEVFALLGSSERLSIMIVLHGSEFIRHAHKGVSQKGCLSFSEIREATEIDSETRLSYHLSKLIDGGLITKIPFKDSKGRVFPLYTVTDKWREFASDLGLDEQIKKYIKEKYPEVFIGN